ncbi:MAG TPA: hypothetical protein DEA22_00150 [Blastocatellia bacterium]|nr:hypothetical protein [Blastocatellia bacterium]
MTDKQSPVLGFVLLGVLVYAGYLILPWLASSIKDVNPSVGVALITGAGTVISSVFIASYNSRKAKERVAFEAHREKKAEVYNEFMGVVIELMRNAKMRKEGEDLPPKNVEAFFYKFTAKVTVYGSPGVVKAYANWRSSSVSDDAGVMMLSLIDKLFREMRADLGESNKGIAANELIGLYVTGGKSQIAKEANNAINPDK